MMLTRMLCTSAMLLSVWISAINASPVRKLSVSKILANNLALFSSSSTTSSSSSEGSIASGSYSDGENHASNFGQLYIETNENYSDNEQGFAAGFVEGYLTAERTYQHAYNMMCQVDCSGIAPPEVKTFFTEQDLWVRQQIEENAATDDLWSFVSTLVHQLDGLMAGYAASDFGKENPMDPWSFTMVNAMGDLFDIIPATSLSKRPNFDAMTHKQARDYLNRNGHCSALIKAKDDLSDIYVGHSSWFTYSAMLRIYKTYKFHLSNKSQKTKTVAFSSYPGSLSSLDDMYLMEDSQMIMTQTTNSIYNATLWDLVKPQSLLAWHRVRAANRLSNSGPEWFDIVSRYNSGTYNNQYMILDTKLFAAGNALQENTLFVVEQIPGLVVGADVTKELERGYWSSFNVPYHHEIYDASGYLSVDAKNNAKPYTEYQMAPRSSIFRRDQYMGTDLEGMQKIMRENDFQTDPLSNGPWDAICARGDLDTTSANPYGGGGYDTKITSINMMKGVTATTEGEEGTGTTSGQQSMWVSLINGPTSQGQETFVWSTSGLTDRHMGQPDAFDFVFEDVYSAPF